MNAALDQFSKDAFKWGILTAVRLASVANDFVV
jgi:hypothetical protein